MFGTLSEETLWAYSWRRKPDVEPEKDKNKQTKKTKQNNQTLSYGWKYRGFISMIISPNKSKNLITKYSSRQKSLYSLDCIKWWTYYVTIIE